MTKKYLFTVALSLALLNVDTANAYTTSNPGASRIFTFDSSNFFSGVDDNQDWLVSAGEGNLNTRRNLPPGWSVYVDGSKQRFNPKEFTVTGLGKTFGSFNISSNIWHIGEKWYSYAIGLKVGNSRSPDWAIFGLEQFAQSGQWSDAPKKGGGLFYWMVYRQEVGAPPSQVPLTGSAWMMLTGLIGFLGFSRGKTQVSKLE